MEESVLGPEFLSDSAVRTGLAPSPAAPAVGAVSRGTRVMGVALGLGFLAAYALGAGAPSVARADRAQAYPQDGLYGVEARLELPHIAGAAATKAATVCLSGTGGTGGLGVLGDNNPLATCPASNVRRSGAEVTFDIVCPGANAARAAARFALMPQGFRGRIAMNMGGKNMTMTEIQIGRRIGDCPRGD